MTAVLVSKNAFPTYIAVSSDLSSYPGSASAPAVIAGIYFIGKTVYLTDTDNWYIISGSYNAASAGLVLQNFVMPKLET